MSGYTNMNEEMLWSSHSKDSARNPYYNGNFGDYNMGGQQLDFQSFENQDTSAYPSPSSYQMYPSKELLEPMQMDYANTSTANPEYDEPPLLEELEIYPDRIMEKTLAVLNPFRAHSLADDSDFLARDSDLAGPLTFCLVLAVCLFIAGNKAHFGYIYGLSMFSCLAMYCLLTLMTTATGIFSLTSVASILGYSLLPIVGLSLLGVFLPLTGWKGIVLTLLSVAWSSLSASRLFAAMSGDNRQRLLVAYPCGLVYGVFALLVVF